MNEIAPGVAFPKLVRLLISATRFATANR
jgi:hypothetical protein